MDRSHDRALRFRVLVALLGFVSVTACGSDDSIDAGATDPAVTDVTTAETAPSTTADEDADDVYPDVIEVASEQSSDGTWTFTVTLSSPYDTPARYADAWRVLGPDGDQLGFRLLTHDHANEQPFTRSQSGIEIPDEVEVVTVEARDLVNGWGGATLDHELER